MIILDTNVLSALMQQQPDPVVVNWLDAQVAEAIWISSITLFEARYGLALLPAASAKHSCNSALSNWCSPTWPTGCLCLMCELLTWPPTWPPSVKNAVGPLTCATPSLPA